MAEDIFNFEDAGVKLPLEDVAPEYYTVTNPQTGKKEAKLAQDLNAAQIKAFAAQENKNYPTFGVSGGKVSVVGNQKYLDSDIVNSTIKTLQEYYKGADLTNEQVAENFQNTLDEVNKQVKSQLQYQEYADFLDKTGFSDTAYRNYSLAVQESDPKTTTNLLKSKKKFYGLKKDGTLTDEPMTPDQWLTYWKENYNPEERAQLWMDGAEALARASKGGTDNDLYAALPYILMGHTETRNIPSAILNMINPFNGMDVNEDLAQAGVVTPIYGFDDTNDLSVFTQAFIRQLGMRGLEIASDVATFDNPWSELGATSGGQYFGIPDWDDSDLETLTRDEYQELADTARAAVKAGFDTYEKMEKEYGAETAKKLWTVYSFSKTDPSAVGGGKVLDTIRNEKGEVVAEEGDYPGYKTYQDFQSRLAEWRKGRGGFETWSQSAIDDMNKYVSQMSVYSPNSATAGIVAGQIASFVAEQAALSLVTGGALSAPNVAARASKLFNVGAAKALEATKIGQKVASLSPSLAKAINAMAVSTSATALGTNGYRLGKTALALNGATRASKVLYTLGSIGNWAIREVGEDALRGLVDDTITKNSFDSQGNLDPNKLVENVYMNAVMLGLAKGAKFTLGGLGSVIDAAGAKNIDGVELNTTQRHQLNLFQKALDDQYSRVQFRGWDADGHPEITVNGRTKVLDQITPSGETAEAIQEVTGVAAPTAARTLESILEDENVPEATKQKIADILEQKRVADEANGGAAENWKEEIKTKIQESLDDDEIRQAFPDGTIKIGDDTIKIDTKEFTSGDVNRVTGKEFASMDEAIEGLKNARTTSNFASAINGILRQSIDFARNFKNAVQEFADANNMTVRDVMVAIRESRLAGEETIPGLRELWETHWKPVQERLLDVQETITGIRPASHDFYFRDMLEGTFNPSASGAWTINDTGILGLLGGDADFDLSASSTARNTGKLGELAADKLEYDPEVLAREFVASRMQTIWQSDDMGKIFATMQEAHDAGEFEFTEAQAAKSVGAVQRAAKEVEDSEGVQSIQKMVNVDELSADFGKEDMAKLDEDIKAQKKVVSDLEAEVTRAEKEQASAPEIDSANYRTGIVESDRPWTEPSNEGFYKFTAENINRPSRDAGDIGIEQTLVTPGGPIDTLNAAIRSGEVEVKNGKVDEKALRDAIEEGYDEWVFVKNFYDDPDVSSEYDITDVAEQLGLKYTDGKSAEEAVKNFVIDEAVKKFYEGNTTTKNNIILYRVVSSDGNEVATQIIGGEKPKQGNIDWLKKESGDYVDNGVGFVTMDPGAVLSNERLAGSGDRYILRMHIAEGTPMFTFDNRVVTGGSDIMLGDTYRMSRGDRAGGEFALAPTKGKFVNSGEADANGNQIVDVYIGQEPPKATPINTTTAEPAASATNAKLNAELATERQKLADLEQRKAAAASITAEGAGKSLAKELDDAVEADKKSVLETQRTFNKSAKTPEETIKDIDAKIKAEKDNIKAIKEETTYEWEEDGKTVKKTLDDNIKDTEKQLDEQQAEVDSFAPKTDASEVPKMDYKTRNELAKSYAKHNPEYIVAYRRQPKGVDKWYSNGTGTRAGDLDDFSSYGSDKGDLTDAVWLTTDEKWAAGKSKASAGNYNGEPDQTVVVLIPKSSIIDGGGEQPIAPKGKGEFTDSWGNDRYTIRGFSKANEDKIVQTRATESSGWHKAREANEAAGRTPVTDAMRYRLNPDFYEKTELVLFRDTQPDIIDNSNKLILEEYNSKHKTENEFFAKKAQRRVDETQSVLDGLLEKKQKLDDAEENLKNLEEMKKKLQNAKTPEETARVIDEEELNQASVLDKKTMVNAQSTFNKSAKRSNAAELISRNSGYSRRGVRVNPSKKLVGVNYMPGNPLGKFGSLFNDNFIKGNSIKMEFAGYKADGTPTRMAITAYNGGYKMYAEAGSFARNVVIDVRNGMSLWDAIYKQVYDNGFFIEPSNNQRAKYGALTVSEQAAKVTDKFMDRMLADRRFAHVFSDDGTVKSTDGLVAILTTRFRGQGINDFTKFLRKADWDSFTKAEQSWLNARAYEMTASTNKSTFKKIIDGFIKGSMALRYRSNMGWNLKNGQLQLTECQRAFTANKIGDFGATIKRLATDSEFRAEVSDRTYILAADSVGAGFSKADLDKVTDAHIQLASESVINKNGIITDIDKLKAKFKDFDDSLLGSVQGGEYAKNYILIAGFTAAGKRAGLSGAELDTYVRNRFNVEALAGTNVGKIGLTDSRIGQFTFMYLGFPIRELTLQAHLIKGGGTVGGKGFKKALGSLDYIAKMLGAKGAVWAMEAPWGYSLLDQIGIDPFGVLNQYDPIQTDWEEREPGWRWLDLGIQYNPFLQGAMTSVVSDIYMAYRAAEEEARADYMKEHNGSTDGFEWSMFEDGGDEFQDIMKGLTPVGEQVWGFVPGRTFYQRIEGELQDLNRGYHISRTGNRMYEANTDPGNALWGMLTGRRNTANAQDYYQTANPIRGAIEGGWAGLGQQMGRGFGSLNPFRGFREFDPADSETYTDWFDGSYNDQQNWNTGVYAFREEAQQIKDKYDKYITQGKELATQNSRENEFADLRTRLEKFVEAYTDKHPEGISYSKQNQLVNIFNLGDYQPTVDEAVREAEGDVDYTQWNAAQDRYAQGNFPTPYGLRQTKEGENVYGQSPQLEQVLSQQRYGIDSDVAPTISKMFKNQQFDTPLGRMTMKDYKDKVYAQISPEYDKDKPDYKKISQLQEEYLETLSKNVIQPILNTYGQSVLSAGKSSEIMQEFGRMLNGMIPSEEYRIDKKGRKIYQSTPYMSVDIKSWLNKNFKAYSNNVNTTNRATKDRIQSIRDSLDQGHTSTAMSKVRALIQDIGNGRASVSREELEWLQGVLND